MVVAAAGFGTAGVMPTGLLTLVINWRVEGLEEELAAGGRLDEESSTVESPAALGTCSKLRRSKFR